MSARPKPENIYRCRHCDAVLGVCTDQVLTVGTAQFTRPVTIKCIVCKREATWRPSDSK